MKNSCEVPKGDHFGIRRVDIRQDADHIHIAMATASGKHEIHIPVSLKGWLAEAIAA